MKEKKYLIIVLLGILFVNGKNIQRNISFEEINFKEEINQNEVQKDCRSVTELLDLHWKIGVEHGYGAPLVENGIAFLPMGLEYSVDILTGKKLFFSDEETQKYFRDNFKDSIVLFNSKKQVTVINLFNGEQIFNLKRKRSWPFFNAPEIIKVDKISILHDNNHLVTYDIKTQSVLWTFDSELVIYDKILINNEEFFISDSKYLYCLSHEGETKWKIELGEFACNPIIEDNILYVYIIRKGLFAINLRQKEINWVYNNKYKFDYIGSKLLINEKAVIFMGPYLYAIDKYKGEMIWKADGFRSSITHSLSFINGDIVAYNNIESIPLISILNDEGKLAYELFTSKTYPPSSKNETFSYMDNFQFMFADNIENNLLIALPETEDSLYCFQIKTPKP